MTQGYRPVDGTGPEEAEGEINLSGGDIHCQVDDPEVMLAGAEGLNNTFEPTVVRSFPGDITVIASETGKAPDVARVMSADDDDLQFSRSEFNYLLQYMEAKVHREMDQKLAKKDEELERKLAEKDEEFNSLLNARINKAMVDMQTPANQDAVLGDSAELEKPREEEWHAPFGESIYTFFYMCAAQSQGFLYALFVYGIQMATIILTLVDIVDRDATDNPLQLPPMVDVTVTTAQAVTLFIVLAYMSDLIEAFDKIQDGFYPEVLHKHPGATYNTWLVSCLAQATAGLMVLTASFVLTMQASTVIDLMLNLTALLFIAEIDDIAFGMAKMGFITNQLQIDAENLGGFEVPKRHKVNVHRRILYLACLAGLFVGYGVLKKRQLEGYYLQTFLYVQFGDAYNSKIPYYSGVMSSGNVRTPGYRAYFDQGTEGIMLSYCDEGFWTFTDTDDSCLGYFARSYSSKEYDVTAIPDSEWQVVDSIQRLQPFDSFSLVGRDCDSKICQGQCLEGVCECPHDRFGMDCEFSSVCPHLVLDGRTEVLPIINYYSEDADDDWGISIFSGSDEFELLKDNVTDEFIKVYNMPVYYSAKIYPASIMFFGGRRWVITSERDFLDNFTAVREEDPSQNFFPQKTAEKFQDVFHAYHQATYKPFFLSDPVDFETPDFLPTPSGLTWWTVGVMDESTRLYGPDTPVETLFNCKTCLAHDEGFCGLGGTCNITTGACDCFYGFNGHKCEVQDACYDMDLPCWGDGYCDELSGICRCNWPSDGNLCDVVIQCFEEDGGCQNGGDCNTTIGHCVCPDDPALTGWACEKFADCNVYGCANGGVCALNGKCACRPPFTGIHCDLIDAELEEFFCSEDDHCFNGSCNGTTGVCSCNDPHSYGSLCEHQDNCTWGGCFNGGMCNQESGLCQCKEPFIGPDCVQEPACVDDFYCEEYYGEGSMCDLGTGSCQCGWEFYYVGKSCEINCRLTGCHNGGHCSEHGYCECPLPFTGNFCDYIAEDSATVNNITERLGACVDYYGFPPYDESSNGTDCVSELTNNFGFWY